MGKFSQPRGEQSLRVPPTPKEGKSSIGEQKAAAINQFSPHGSTLAKNRKIIMISICAVAAVLLISTIVGIWFFLGNPNDDGLILNNVMVSGINLGGMTKKQAEDALLQATSNTYTKNDMVVELPDATIHLSPADTGAELDIKEVVKAAYEYGRTGSRAEREAIREASLTTTHHIPLLNYLNLNLDYIKGELDAYGAAFNSTYVPSSVSFDIGVPILDAGNPNFREDAPCQVMTLTIGMPGRYIDIDALYNQILDAYSFHKFHVTAQMSSEEKLPDPLDIEALYAAYRVEPTDAYLDVVTTKVVPEIYGYDFDLEQALLLMEQAKYGDTIEIPFRFLLPEVHGVGLSDLLFRDVLGAFKTEHTNNPNRNTNLTLACAKINGLVLDPGETFDFNTVVGERTSAAGYKSADAYSNGETVKTLGGGICQVSSTLYYCTLLADLEIVTRSPHSYVSSYMPMGTDATVSWGGPDFAFKNSTNYPIRIEAKVEDGFVHVQLVGTDEKDYYIEMEYEIIGSEAPEIIYQDVDEDNPDGYEDGDTIVSAYKGYTVKTYKVKYDKETGELIAREYDRTSRYKKRDKVVARIEKPTEPPTEAPAPEDPTETMPPEDDSPTENPPVNDTPVEDPPENDPPADSGSENSSGGSGDGGSGDGGSGDGGSSDGGSSDGGSSDGGSSDGENAE